MFNSSELIQQINEEHLYAIILFLGDNLDLVLQSILEVYFVYLRYLYNYGNGFTNHNFYCSVFTMVRKDVAVIVLREAIQKKREYIRTLDLKEGGGQFENLIS